ncbi:hatching enzyme 1.2-like [Onthophagus taurus]|uniref:hatching enzyme 1.2-like n=1 Tax=Onthophagus taurus TaxID=166361 RepID=UPI0039BE3763
MNYLGVFLFVLGLWVYITKSFPVTTEEEFESEPNLRSGSVINSWNDSWEVNPDELGNYFQGDIITTTTNLRSITRNESLRWPYGIVPFVIAGPYNDEGLDLLEWAINQYHMLTCVRFRPKEPFDHDYLYITNGFTGCWSSLGRQGGKQELNLQHPGCLSTKRRGTAIHELMHALGIKHEHTRIDRDQHIAIMNDNINPARMINFERSNEEDVTNFGIPYDFGSVMHYSMYAFSKDYGKKPTITPKMIEELMRQDGSRIKMGQRQGFGENDVKKLNIMYCPPEGLIHPGPIISLRKPVEETIGTAAEWWTNALRSFQNTFNPFA